MSGDATSAAIEWTPEAEAFVRAGQNIKAIKEIRAHNGCGLRSARLAVMEHPEYLAPVERLSFKDRERIALAKAEARAETMREVLVALNSAGHTAAEEFIEERFGVTR